MQKQDLVINDQQCLIWNKTKRNQTKLNPIYFIYMYKKEFGIK